jgi:hypothetical protein
MAIVILNSGKKAVRVSHALTLEPGENKVTRAELEKARDAVGYLFTAGVLRSLSVLDGGKPKPKPSAPKAEPRPEPEPIAEDADPSDAATKPGG